MALISACLTLLVSGGRRFGIAKTVRLNPLSDAKEYDTSNEFKLSFSFSGERLLVPWITVTDGKAHFVQQIDFYFVHAQGFILSVKWRATCQLPLFPRTACHRGRAATASEVPGTRGALVSAAHALYCF